MKQKTHTQGRKQQAAGPQQGGTQQSVKSSSRRDSESGPGQQQGMPDSASLHPPQRISQQAAQNIPADPDPDDPVSP